MRIIVLGAAAGGGFPQWNCNARTSRQAWNGDVLSSTQSSLAVSADGAAWVLLNASPDIRQQIAVTPELQPRANGPPRDSPIRGIVLTSGEVDHVGGLLSLRERQRMNLYAASSILKTLANNSIFDVLSHDHVIRCPLLTDPAQALEWQGGTLGLTAEAFAVPGKQALYLESGANSPDATIGLKITEDATGRFFYFIPACAAIDAPLRNRLRGAPLVFFDGTLYSDDELIVQDLSQKSGRRMGHISMSGDDGAISAFAGLDVERRIFVHINTSNPVLIPGSAERDLVELAGWEIAYDGMEVRL